MQGVIPGRQVSNIQQKRNIYEKVRQVHDVNYRIDILLIKYLRNGVLDETSVYILQMLPKVHARSDL